MHVYVLKKAMSNRKTINIVALIHIYMHFQRQNYTNDKIWAIENFNEISMNVLIFFPHQCIHQYKIPYKLDQIGKCLGST